MSILLPLSPKRAHMKLPTSPTSPKQNIIRKEMELNRAEANVLKEKNSQLEIETNSLRKELKYLKKSISYEVNQRPILTSEEEKKLETKLASLDETYDSIMKNIANERNEQKKEIAKDLNKQIQDIKNSQTEFSSAFQHSQQELKDFMQSAKEQLIKSSTKSQTDIQKLKEIKKSLENTYSAMVSLSNIESL